MRKEARMSRTGAHRPSPAVVPVEGGARSERQVLEAISAVASRQRAAILARDSRALNRSFDALLALMGDLTALADSGSRQPSGAGDRGATSLASLARHVQSQLAINRALVHHGMTIVDHYVAVVSEVAASANQALFSGVG
jgi:hypothetical protein